MKYNQSWRTLRLNHGLRWAGTELRPCDIPHKKMAVIIALAVFCMMALVMAIHYQNESVKTGLQRCDIQAQSVWPNAKAHFYFNNDTGLGYGKTVAVCNGVELIGV